MPSELDCQEKRRACLAQHEPLWGGWKIADYIGAGQFGCVFKIVKESSTGILESALKVIPVPGGQGRRERRSTGSLKEKANRLFRELDVHREAGYHPNLDVSEKQSFSGFSVVYKKTIAGVRGPSRPPAGVGGAHGLLPEGHHDSSMARSGGDFL